VWFNLLLNFGTARCRILRLPSALSRLTGPPQVRITNGQRESCRRRIRFPPVSDGRIAGDRMLLMANSILVLLRVTPQPDGEVSRDNVHVRGMAFFGRRYPDFSKRGNPTPHFAFGSGARQAPGAVLDSFVNEIGAAGAVHAVVVAAATILSRATWSVAARYGRQIASSSRDTSGKGSQMLFSTPVCRDAYTLGPDRVACPTWRVSTACHISADNATFARWPTMKAWRSILSDGNAQNCEHIVDCCNRPSASARWRSRISPRTAH